MTDKKIKKWILYLIIIYLSLFTFSEYYQSQLSHNYGRLTLHKAHHEEVVTGNTIFPAHEQRILVPKTINVVITFFEKFYDYDLAFQISYSIYYIIILFLIYTLLFKYINNWFSDSISLLGIFIVSTIIKITFQIPAFNPDSFMELFLFTLFLYLLYKKQILWLFPLMIFAGLNRETALFYPFLYLFYNINYKKLLKLKFPIRFKKIIIFIILMIITILSCQTYISSTNGLYQFRIIYLIQERFSQQIKAIPRVIFNNIMFLGIFWILPFLKLNLAPKIMKTSLLVIPMFILGILAIGAYDEVRMLIFLYPLMIPLSLGTIFGYNTKQS
jgi:hypothetical protein